MTQSDEPPRAAVEAVAAAYWVGVARLEALRALPDADVWPLVAYLAQGREPTEAMVEAGNGARWSIEAAENTRRTFAAMLAAAAQGGDDAKG